MKQINITIIFLVFSVILGVAQPVKINSDRSATITFAAPSNAKKIQIEGSVIPSKNFPTPAGVIYKGGKANMQKNGNVWVYTTSVLPSEFYTFRFIVDDKPMIDMANPQQVRDIDCVFNYFVVAGDPGNNYRVNNKIQHGSLKKVWYTSSLNGHDKRRMTIYTPAGYTENKTQKYPVLYLLHGSGGDENSWSDCGRVCQILDNLIAANRCKPMIVVMPNGNVDLAAAPGEDPNNPNVKPSSKNISSMFGKFELTFVKEIVSYVDQNYRTIANKQNRAIAGLSLGGLHTLYITLNNPSCFDYIGLFSAQTTNALSDSKVNTVRGLDKAWNSLKETFPFMGGGKVDEKISAFTSRSTNGELAIYENLDTKLSTLFSSKPQLYYIAVGRDDFVKKLNDDYRNKLDASGYSYIYNETDGGHTWENWRKYLVDFLPRLF